MLRYHPSVVRAPTPVRLDDYPSALSELKLAMGLPWKKPKNKQHAIRKRLDALSFCFLMKEVS